MLYVKALIFHYKDHDLEHTIPKEKRISFDFKSQSKEIEQTCVATVVYGMLPSATYVPSNRMDLIAIRLVGEGEEEGEVVLLPELSKKFQFPALDMTTARNMVETMGKLYASKLLERA